MSIEKFKKDSMFHRIKASYLDESSVVLSQREEEKKPAWHMCGRFG